MLTNSISCEFRMFWEIEYYLNLLDDLFVKPHTHMDFFE